MTKAQLLIEKFRRMDEEIKFLSVAWAWLKQEDKERLLETYQGAIPSKYK